MGLDRPSLICRCGAVCIGARQAVLDTEPPHIERRLFCPGCGSEFQLIERVAYELVSAWKLAQGSELNVQKTNCKR